MKSFLVNLWRRLWFVVAFGLVIVALGLSATRGALNILEDHREALLAWLVEDTSITIDVAKLDAKIQNFRPKLVLSRVSLGLKDHPAIKLSTNEILLEVDLFASAQARTLILKDLTLDGTNLTVPFRTSITSQQASETQSQNAINTFDMAEWVSLVKEVFLQTLSNFTLLNTHLTIQGPEGIEKTLSLERLVWQNTEDLYQGNGSIQLDPDNKSSNLDFRVDLHSSQGDLQQLRGELYLDGNHIDFDDFGLLFDVPPQRQLKSDISFELWGKFGHGQNSRWLMQFEPSSISWQKSQRQHQFNLSHGQVELREYADAWVLNKHPWELQHNQQPLEDFGLSAKFFDNNISAVLGELNLAHWVPVFSAFEPKEETALESWVKSGHLDYLQFSYQLADSEFQYNAKLRDIYTNSTTLLPQVDNLMIRFEGDQQSAEIELKQQGGSIAYSPLFDQALDVENIDIEFSVHRNNQDFEVVSSNSSVAFTFLDLESQWSLKWGEHQAPFLSLVANANLKDVGQAASYFPNIMTNTLDSYLRRGLQAGTVDDAQILWHGAFEQFPYRNHQGIFQAMVPIQAARFEYAEGWPVLEDLNLSLLFQNNGMFIEAPSIGLDNINTGRVNAAIPEFGDDPHFVLNGMIQGESVDLVNYLARLPISGVVAGVEALDVSSGQFHGELNLDLPLEDLSQSQTYGEFDLVDTALRIKAIDLQLNRVNSRFTYHNDRLQSNNIRAAWRNLPVQASFKSGLVEEDYNLGIALYSQWPSNRLAKSLTLPLETFAAGRLDWRGDVQLQLKAGGDIEYQASVVSDLQDFEIKLPEPLHKAYSDTLPSFFSFSGNQSQGKFNLDLSDYAYAHGRYQTGDQGISIVNTTLELGASKGLNWLEPGLRINLDYPEVNLKDWSDWYQQLPDLVVASEPGATNATQRWDFPEIKYIRGQIEQAWFNHQDLNKFQFSYLPDSPTPYQIDSDEFVATLVIEQAETAHYQVNIKKALLPKFGKAPETDEVVEEDEITLVSSTQQAANTERFSETISSLYLSCKQCQIGSINLGEVELNLPVEQHTVKDGSLKLKWPHSEFNGAILWNTPELPLQTNLSGQLSSTDFASFISNFGAVSPVETKDFKLDMDLAWQGQPFNFNKQSLDGEFTIKTGKGVLTEVSDKGTRVFTLGSLDTIRRRLQLDFSDVFEKGLHFDQINLKGTLKDGVMENKNAHLDGVAGTMRASGKIDLNDGKIDYKVSYSPDVTSSLPILTAFLVTPITGAAVFALSKLLEPAVEVITQIDFSLTGNLNAPELIEMKRSKGKVDVPEELIKEQK